MIVDLQLHVSNWEASVYTRIGNASAHMLFLRSTRADYGKSARVIRTQAPYLIRYVGFGYIISPQSYIKKACLGPCILQSDSLNHPHCPFTSIITWKEGRHAAGTTPAPRLMGHGSPNKPIRRERDLRGPLRPTGTLQRHSPSHIRRGYLFPPGTHPRRFNPQHHDRHPRLGPARRRSARAHRLL